MIDGENARRGEGRTGAIVDRSRTTRLAWSAVVSCAALAPAQSTDLWPGPGAGPSRPGVVNAPPPVMGSPAWTATVDDTGARVSFLGGSGVAVTPPSLGDFVFALGRVSRPGGPADESRLLAFRRATGECAWSRPVASPVTDSQSQPVVDAANRSVITATGDRVAAFDTATGTLLWYCTLDRPIVNASPVVTDDLGPADRAFITDYDGFGAEGRLYCINVDAFDEHANPHQPGGRVWSVQIGGTSGNTPAYLPCRDGGAGLVYAASVGEFGFSGGKIFAFPAGTAGPPAPAWVFENTIGLGFFGGVSLGRPEVPGGRPPVYAASYSFGGGLDAANLVKLDGETGQLRWSAPCNRTLTTPIVLPGGRVVVSGGIQGFGALPSLRLYRDLGTTAMVEWDTVPDTWQDLDGDGLVDTGEYLRVGGWTHQPVACLFEGRTTLVCGVIPFGQFSSPAPDLFVLDLDAPPASDAFVIGHIAGPGGSPATVAGGGYSVGTAGLVSLVQHTAGLDVNGDGRRTIDDLYAWESGVGDRDINADGAIDDADRWSLLVGTRTPWTLRGGGAP